MNCKFAKVPVLLLAMALVASAAHAQTNGLATNLVPVTIYLTPANAALVADFQSNDVPLDSVITLGARATLNQARGRLLDEISHLPYKDLAAAYPQLVPITDTNATPAIQEQQLRTLVSMQLSKIKNSGDACRMYALIQAAQHGGPVGNPNGNAASTNAPPQVQGSPK